MKTLKLISIYTTGDMVKLDDSNQVLTKKKLTLRDYDLAELAKLSNNSFMEIAYVLYMHFQRKNGHVLIMNPLMGIFTRISNPLIQVHLFRKPATGKLSRYNSYYHNMETDIAYQIITSCVCIMPRYACTCNTIPTTDRSKDHLIALLRSLRGNL